MNIKITPPGHARKGVDFMNDLKDVKLIAEQLLALSVELLQVVDENQTERQQFYEYLKKMPRGR